MKTVLRQDGSAVELSDDDAAQWIKRGLATVPPVITQEKPAATFGRKLEPTTNEGEQA